MNEFVKSIETLFLENQTIAFLLIFLCILITGCAFFYRCKNKVASVSDSAVISSHSEVVPTDSDASIDIDAVEPKPEVIASATEKAESKAEVVNTATEVIEPKSEANDLATETIKPKPEKAESKTEVFEEAASKFEAVNNMTESKSEVITPITETIELKTEVVNTAIEAVESKVETVEPLIEATEFKTEAIDEAELKLDLIDPVAQTAEVDTPAINADETKPAAITPMIEKTENIQAEASLTMNDEGAQRQQNWLDILEIADPRVHPILHFCLRHGLSKPKVRLEYQNEQLEVLGILELAWPELKIALVLNENEKNRAENAGWKVFLPEELEGKLTVFQAYFADLV